MKIVYTPEVKEDSLEPLHVCAAPADESFPDGTVALCSCGKYYELSTLQYYDGNWPEREVREWVLLEGRQLRKLRKKISTRPQDLGPR